MSQPGLEGVSCLSWTHSEWGTLNMVWLLLWGAKVCNMDIDCGLDRLVLWWDLMGVQT